MENTPLGNVLMYWDHDKEVFVYYSDLTIPYRMLESVARKYAITFRCKSIYIDMEEELERAKAKIEEAKKRQEEEEKQEQEEEEQQEEKRKTNQTSGNKEEKKSVFAKLKSYNREGSISSVPKNVNTKNTSNSMNKSANTNAQTKSSDDMIIKERSNRYSYEGKMMNFNFLKKVARGEIDKTYNLSFKEFKSMQKK
jgi:hypothetical protein